jgi:hypothetical protein
MFAYMIDITESQVFLWVFFLIVIQTTLHLIEFFLHLGILCFQEIIN